MKVLFRSAKISILLIFLSIMLALNVNAYEQSHPLSQIYPIDVNLNMYGFNVTNTSYVGVGTGVPEYPLDVFGSGRFTGNLYVGGTIYGSLNGEITAGGNLNMNGYDLFNATNLNATNLNLEGVFSISGADVIDSNRNLVGINAVKQNLIPESTNTYSLGTSSNKWANIYAINGYFTNIQTENINGGSPVTGSGSTNYIPVWTGSSSLDNSIIYQTGGNVGINTVSPAYTLDVNGSVRATKSLTAGINVETLSGDKTLTPGTDEMYQYLDPNGTNRIITLDTANAKPGDKFIIRHNGAYTDSYYLEIRQGYTVLDRIYAGAIKEFIFDGTNWVSAEVGSGEKDEKKYNVAIGYESQGYSYGAAVGYRSQGYEGGAAIGYDSQGYSYGAAVGYRSQGYSSGAAVGYNAKGYSWGAAIGRDSQGYSYGAAIGYDSQGYSSGAAVGYNAKGYSYGAAIGYDSQGYSSGAAVGYNAKGMRYGAALGYMAGFHIDTNADRYNTLVGAYSGYQLTTGKGNIILGYKSGYDSTYSPTTGSYNILIGYQAWTPSHDTSNFLNIGGLIFGTNLSTTPNTISTGNVGIGTASPQNKLNVIGDINATGYVYGLSGLCIGTDCKTSWSQVGGGGVGPWDNSTTQIFVRTGYPLFINVSNTLFVDGASGKVGVNTQSPSYSLDVFGSGRFTGDLHVGGIIYGNLQGTITPTSNLNMNAHDIYNATNVNATRFFQNGKQVIDTINAGGGISVSRSGGSVTISHTDTSSQESVDNSGLSFIQDVTLDEYGHVTGLGTNTIVAGNGLTASGTTLNVGAGTGISVSADTVSINTSIVPRKNVDETITGKWKFDNNFSVDSNTLYVDSVSHKVGIGTASPQAKLDVIGAIKIGDTSSPCDASHRGVLKLVPGDSGVDDKLYMCMKNSTDNYVWVLIARGG